VIDRPGRVLCWGLNDAGQVGTAVTDEPVPVPTVVGGLSGAREVGAGGATSCARTADGRIFCWGVNDFGQLGDARSGHDSCTIEGTIPRVTDCSPVPVMVVGL
jgi:alpha-tubulin suppressor-like RCC1 family protein